jgi:DNA-3-methyladenine glycosylase I
MTDTELNAVLTGSAVIRHRLKIWSVRDNAAAALGIIKEHGSLDSWLWAFVDGQPKVNNWRRPNQVPATTEISDRMSKAMRKQGFRFVGSTICYAFMQATGMVDDHLVTCSFKGSQ